MKRGKLWSSQLNFWMVNCYKVVDGKNCKFFSFFFSESSKCRYIHCLPLLDSIDCHLWLPLFNNISTLSQYYQYYYYLFPPWNIIIIIMLNALWVTFMYSADQNFLSFSLSPSSSSSQLLLLLLLWTLWPFILPYQITQENMMKMKIE